MALVMSPNCSSMLNSHGGIKHLHPELEDHPRVAAIDDGGPPMDPGNLTDPVEFDYEVSPLTLSGSEDANDIAGTRFLCPEWTQAKVPCGS
jgi:hypothetical protein